MLVVLIVPTLLSALLMAAHLMRWGLWWLALACVLFPLVLLIRRSWAKALMQGVLVIWAAEWARTTLLLVGGRMAASQPWLRMAAILLAVVCLNLLAAWLYQTHRLRAGYR